MLNNNVTQLLNPSSTELLLLIFFKLQNVRYATQSCVRSCVQTLHVYSGKFLLCVCARFMITKKYVEFFTYQQAAAFTGPPLPQLFTASSETSVRPLIR